MISRYVYGVLLAVIVASSVVSAGTAHAIDLVSQNFDTAAPPELPAGWQSITSGATWTTSTGTVHPSGYLAHSGSNLVYLNSYTAPSGSSSALVSPSFSLAGVSGGQVKFWIYRDSVFSATADKVEVYINSVAGITATATLLGTVNRSKTLPPAETSDGWYEYTFVLPGSGTTNYIIINGTSDWGNDIHLDDISVVCTSVPASQNFDSVTPPVLPVGWQSNGVSWAVSTGTVNPPGIAAHSGSNLIYFNSFSTTSGSSATFVLPEFSLAGVSGAQVKFWIYRDSGYPDNLDRIEVYQNSVPSLSGTTTPLGTVNRSTTKAPAVGTPGWYEYSFDLTGTGSTNYIIFKGISEYGNDIHLDDIGIDYTNAQSFEAVVAPALLPDGWQQIANNASGYADPIWAKNDGTEYPSGITAHSGSNFVYFNSFVAKSGDSALLVSPVFSLAGVSGAKAKFWMYRDSDTTYTLNDDRVEVYIYSETTWTATLLGTVNRSTALDPVVAAAGWYEYTFDLPGFETANRIVINGISGFGNDVYLDDIVLYSTNENFDAVAPQTLPPGWLSSGVTWSTSSGTVNPSGVASHSGSNLVYFNSFSTSVGSNATLVSRAFSLAGVTGSKAKFWMYRDTGYSATADRIEIYQNSVPSLFGTTTPLGTVNRSTTLAPKVTNPGWYEYSFDLTGSGSTNYIIFKGISEYGNDIHLDDFSIVSSSVSNPTALTVTFAGAGQGSVSSNPSGIACSGTTGSPCPSYSFASGTVVTLTAAATTGSSFAGWGGVCSGTGACQVTMSAAKSVTATFNLTQIQTIGTLSFSPTNLNVGEITMASATGGASPNPIVFSSATPLVCTVGGVNGSTVSGIAAGTCTINANQAGNSTYSAAPQKTGSVTVKLNGTCGGSDKQTLTAKPTGNLCTAGSATAVSGSGPWIWSCNGANTGSNASCRAEIASFTVTANAVVGGSITPLTGTVNYGATASFTITPNSGNSISSGTGGCGGVLAGSTYTTAPITTNCTVTALFAANQYSVSATVSGGNGTVSCTNPVTSGGTSTCAISPASGYRVATFTDNGSDTKTLISGTSYSISNVIANHAIAATFEPLPDTEKPTVAISTPLNVVSGDLYDVSGTAGDNSGVARVEVQIYNTTTKRYVTGSTFTVTPTWLQATTSNSWQSWTLDTFNLAINNLQTTANGAYSITARAVDNSGNISNPAVVSFTRGSGGTGTTTLLVSKWPANVAGTIKSSPTGINCDTACDTTGATFSNAAPVTLTALPSPDYYFQIWSNCDTPNGTACTVSLNGNHTTITAIFDRKNATTLSAATSQTQKLTLNTPLTINGKLELYPAGSSSDLNGQTINITVKPLTGTPVTHTATTTGQNGAWQITLNDFTSVDTYIVEITYAGSDRLLGSATSQPLNILVGKAAGYAIVVQGKTADNYLLNEHRYSVEDIVAKLKTRSFLDEDIYTLYSDSGAGPAKASIQSAIQGWAKTKMIASPAPLYIIMVDHGSVGKFHIGGDTGDAIITPSDLKTWLQNLETALASTPAKYEKRIVIIGACYSGSFISDLAAPGRIVITSSGSDERSIGGDLRPWNNHQPVNSGELFIEELFSNFATGENIKQAFEHARDSVADKDSRRLEHSEFHYGTLDRLMQHPLLDDDGANDISPSRTFSGEYRLAREGNVVAGLELGYGKVRTNAADNPAYIKAIAPTTFLGTAETNGLLWVAANDNSAVDYAFVSVKKPDSGITQFSSGQVILNFDKKDLVFNAAASRWEYTFTGFNQSGTYEIFYYTRDKATGFISPAAKSYVYKAKASNHSPTPFSLISPNGTQESAYVAALWEESTDSDGLTYTLQVSKDPTFATVNYTKEGITDNFAEIPTEVFKNNPNGTTWYWQVIAIDAYGAKELSNPGQHFSFTTSNTNSLPAIIKGYVFSTAGAPISGATVTVNTETSPAVTIGSGGFIMSLQPNTYTLTANASGYTQNTATATASSGAAVSVYVTLAPAANAQFQLTLSLTGDGEGSVNSLNGLSPSINCISGASCPPQSYTSGTPITLQETPSVGSEFNNGWTNCTDTGATCTLSLSANTTVTSRFDSLKWIRLSSNLNKYYGTVKVAYDSIASTGTIQSQSIDFTENLTFDRQNITVTLDGGKDANWSDAGYSTIHGTFKVSSGRVNAGRIKVR